MAFDRARAWRDHRWGTVTCRRGRRQPHGWKPCRRRRRLCSWYSETGTATGGEGGTCWHGAWYVGTAAAVCVACAVQCESPVVERLPTAAAALQVVGTCGKIETVPLVVARAGPIAARDVDIWQVVYRLSKPPKNVNRIIMPAGFFYARAGAMFESVGGSA